MLLSKSAELWLSSSKSPTIVISGDGDDVLEEELGEDDGVPPLIVFSDTTVLVSSVNAWFTFVNSEKYINW